MILRRFTENTNRHDFVWEITTLIDSSFRRVGKQIFTILSSLTSSPNTIESGEIEINIDLHMSCKCIINLTENELYFINSLIEFRSNIDTKFQVTPEMMTFWGNNKKFNYLINVFDSIVLNSQRFKGELIISRKKLEINIDL